MRLEEKIEQQTFQKLMNDALERVPDTIDKREGSIIYDAIAPAIYMLANFYQEMGILLKETYILTATGKYLDYRVEEAGMQRRPGVKATKYATFTDSSSGSPQTIPVGSRWSTISTTNPIQYVVVSATSTAGKYVLECEEVGAIGHVYTGPLVPLGAFPSTITATMGDTVTLGQDQESDADLLARYVARGKQGSFGGNIAQYKEWVEDMTGIGGVQVYPVWNGGGTVKLSLVDDSFEPINQSVIERIVQEIDPTNHSGRGVGLAPINHHVTVVTPVKVPLKVKLTGLKLLPGYEKPATIENIKQATIKYLNEFVKGWSRRSSEGYFLKLYSARVLAVVLEVPGVENVSTISFEKGSSYVSEFEYSQTAGRQELPDRKQVTVVE